MISPKIWLFALAMLWLPFVSCKKKRAFKEENAQTTVEVRMAQGQTDEALKDINLVIMNRNLLRGKPAGESSNHGLEVCGLSLDTSQAGQGIVSILYQGEICDGFKRSGKVKFYIQNYPIQKWKHQGCVMKLEFINYTSTRVVDAQSLELNGTLYLTNTSGKTWYDLVYLFEPEIKQVLTGNNLEASLNGGETSVYNFNREMTYRFSKTDSLVSCFIAGLGSNDGQSALENWGLDSEGNEFTSKVTETLVWKTSCSAYVLFQGEEHIQVGDKPFDLISEFGVDENGDRVNAASGACPFGWKATWSYKKKTSSRVFNFK